MAENGGNKEGLGLFYGFLGVAAFSLTLPVTRLAVMYMDPVFVGAGRAVVAAMLAAVVLAWRREKLPSRQQWKGLVRVALGVIVGFPLLSTWAMTQIPASHGAVVNGLLPLMTAGCAALLARERPSLLFWLTSVAGGAAVVLFAVQDGVGRLQPADLAMFGAVLAAAAGYAEGGRLAREMGGWQVISWALVLSLPVMLVPTLYFADAALLVAPPAAWLGFAYVSVISQFVAFFAWYSGMALGGVARVSQMQYLQPFLTIFASIPLLQEEITVYTVGMALLVMSLVAVGRKAPVRYLPGK